MESLLFIRYYSRCCGFSDNQKDQVFALQNHKLYKSKANAWKVNNNNQKYRKAVGTLNKIKRLTEGITLNQELL